MQTFINPEVILTDYPLRKLGDPDSLLFLDIETTGLTPAAAQIYLIGALTHTADNGWTLHQWFADSLSSESDMLNAFFDFASGYKVLVHYNGDSFDLPFLIRCAAQYGIRNPFDGMTSLDLYRAVRPYRKILGTERMNQKSMERFLGISRTDPFSGAELIRVYEDYCSSGSTALLQQLLLHNEEDITGLPMLLSLMAYRDMFEGEFRNLQGVADGQTFRISGTGSGELPVPVRFSAGDCIFSVSGSDISLSVPLYSGTLNHYFPDYKNYYYLPAEQRCVHKSVAEFVDRSAKVKATAATACVPREGCFLPLYGEAPGQYPRFRREVRSSEIYLELTDPAAADRELLNAELCGILERAGLRNR